MLTPTNASTTRARWSRRSVRSVRSPTAALPLSRRRQLSFDCLGDVVDGWRDLLAEHRLESSVRRAEQEGGRSLEAGDGPLRLRLGQRSLDGGQGAVGHRLLYVEPSDRSADSGQELVGHVARVLLLLIDVEEVDVLPQLVLH